LARNVVEIAYDETSRLLGQTYTGPGGPLGDLAYQYDPTGNRIGTGGSFARALLPAAIGTTSYNDANQQLAFGAMSQAFDNNGNLVTQTDPSGTTSYTWNRGRCHFEHVVGASLPPGRTSMPRRDCIT
jgi:hypothetical protein